jgi:hypothetical protein
MRMRRAGTGALAAVSNTHDFFHVALQARRRESPRALLDHLADLLCYAA